MESTAVKSPIDGARSQRPTRRLRSIRPGLPRYLCPDRPVQTTPSASHSKDGNIANDLHELKGARVSKSWPIIGRDAVGAFGIAMLSISSASAAPPAQLYGKTVHVSWHEDAVSRDVGEQYYSRSG